MIKNRYVTEEDVSATLKEIERRFTYSPPDDKRVQEHILINDGILKAVTLVARVCPKSPETELAIQHLWQARNCANGSLATYVKPETSDEH